MRVPGYILFPVIIFGLCFVLSCGRDLPTIDYTIKDPIPDSDIVLKVDSLVLNTSTSFFVQQSFPFSKKLSNIGFVYWGESDIPASNIPYILTIFRSESGDSSSFVQWEERLDSIPEKFEAAFNFNNGDSCSSVKFWLSMKDTVPPPYVPPNKTIKVRNLKVYYRLNPN